jgi:hypothetical protein
MVMIEAMAVGVPVVALRRGAVPEVIRDGVTGFVCDTVDELPDALHAARELDPRACLEHVRTNFSAPVMAERYERAYHAAIAAHFTLPRPEADRAATARAATELPANARAAARPAASGPRTTTSLVGTATSGAASGPGANLSGTAAPANTPPMPLYRKPNKGPLR